MATSRLLAGVIGDPVAHSRSPIMHNAAFAHHGINAQYERWHTPPAELAARVATLRAPQYLGANVTLPHKVAVLELLDRIDEQAAQIGAVNTIVREADGGLSGWNTDAPAIVATLQETAGFSVVGARVLLLGASGAARAAAFALGSAGAARITVVNRTLERAEGLLADLLATLEHDPLLYALASDDPDLAAAAADATLIINATSLGWREGETPLAAGLIAPHALVLDLVDRETQRWRDAVARGARALDGLDMLVRQAALAFSYWTQQPPPVDVMRSAVSRLG
ncbi:MAG TPA: shikimate dehydrogenase [Roseiflexaceae bacterium]|nr:shikimate dehydrogenase [Roseiflexaceae bacterium]